MIRLIDIVLILLFGFISISHVDRSIERDLPRAAYLPAVPPDFEDWIVVGIMPEGGFICGSDRVEADNAAGLREVLAGFMAQGSERVRLRVDRDQPGAGVAAVLNVCRGLELPVALEVVLERPETEIAFP